MRSVCSIISVLCSISGVSRGTNSEKNWRKDCISECHGRFHLATYFMLKCFYPPSVQPGMIYQCQRKQRVHPGHRSIAEKGVVLLGTWQCTTETGQYWALAVIDLNLATGKVLGFVQFALANAAVPSCPHLRCPCSNPANGKRQLTGPGNNPLMQWLLGLFGNRLWHGIY